SIACAVLLHRKADSHSRAIERARQGRGAGAGHRADPTIDRDQGPAMTWMQDALDQQPLELGIMSDDLFRGVFEVSAVSREDFPPRPPLPRLLPADRQAG